MRWKRKKPKVGDSRVIVRLLLFPKTLEGETRWLEICPIIQIYEIYFDGHSNITNWHSRKWAKE